MWLQKLGFSDNEKVVIFHADDIGLCQSINLSVKDLFDKNLIQSCSIIPNSGFLDHFRSLAIEEWDVGLHTNFIGSKDFGTWNPASKRYPFPVLPIDHTSEYLDAINSEILIEEIQSQWNILLGKGFKPTHIDTHSATVFLKTEFAMSYIQFAIQNQIFPMVVWPKKQIGDRFGSFDYDQLTDLLNYFPYPVLDDLHTVPDVNSYEEKICSFKKIIDEIQPGITQIILHPCNSENLLNRNWDYLAILELKDYIMDQGFTLISWKSLKDKYDSVAQSICE